MDSARRWEPRPRQRSSRCRPRFCTHPHRAVGNSVCSDVHFFSTLRALNTVELVGDESPVDSDELVRSLSHCAQLKTLMVERFDLNGRHLEELLPAFPLLSDCSLELLPQLNSLRCFSTAALASSLTKLTLYTPPLCPPTEIPHLFGLRLLERLYFKPATSLSEELSAEFHVPSQRFPALRVCSCG